jgi:hypothetical protein
MKVSVGDKVKVVTREVTAEDRKSQRYYGHMAGLSGVVQAVFGEDEIAVKIDPEAMTGAVKEVHQNATVRMRERFLSGANEETKSTLTPEEINFPANYVLLVRSSDLEKP